MGSSQHAGKILYYHGSPEDSSYSGDRPCTAKVVTKSGLLELEEKYKPSEPCNCMVCRNYCLRPGWWTAHEAEHALEAGYASRMMLELSPRDRYGILSPAFKGNEGYVALQVFSMNACTFFTNGLCELFGTGLQPLECRYCHHNRKGKGLSCHREIGRSWDNTHAQSLIVKWGNITGFWRKQGYILTPR